MTTINKYYYSNFFPQIMKIHSSFFQPIGLYNGKYEWASRPGSGDCSLKLMEVDIKFDDGLWECQVTASSFESQDALASKPARLVVRGKNENKMIFFYSTSHSFILYCRISCFSPEEMNVPYVTNGPNPILESNSCVFFAICCKLQNHRFQYVFAGKISEMLQRIYGIFP